jgi:hypothetical protein
MFIAHILRIRYFAVLILTLVIAANVYALAASNTVAASQAGDGTGIITAYNVGQIKYTLDEADNPTDIMSVQFEVNKQGGSSAELPSEVHARIDGGNWVSCTNIAGVTWECLFSPPYPTVSVSPRTMLEVVAAQ